MSILGNLIWIIFGGLIASIGWFLAGVLCCLTIIGIPFGKQCFKLALLQLAPFGKEVRSTNFGAMGLIGNIIWIVFFGWELCLANLGSAIIFAITIVGIPFSLQSLKLAKLSLIPFGSEIVYK
ncbi:YccF domain-containing protein [Clostridium sediminicola]|uniref:YccF domain-containing protein n=1 Tax=Clostridium sediminicola TaxID=3114879 RepID=UPI0031F23156